MGRIVTPVRIENVAHSGCPVKIQIEGFKPVFTEVLFVDMHPREGSYEPLLGYIVLGQSQVAVDMLGHRLVQAKRMDLK